MQVLFICLRFENILDNPLGNIGLPKEFMSFALEALLEDFCLGRGD